MRYWKGKFIRANSFPSLRLACIKWAIEMALENPSMSVLGVDLSPIQPSEVPSNCSFRVQNIENGWDSDEKFDLIHARAMFIAFEDWLQFFKNCYRYHS